MITKRLSMMLIRLPGNHTKIYLVCCCEILDNIWQYNRENLNWYFGIVSVLVKALMQHDFACSRAIEKGSEL